MSISSSRTKSGSSAGISQPSGGGVASQIIKGEYELKKIRLQYSQENHIRNQDVGRKRSQFNWLYTDTPQYTKPEHIARDAAHFKTDPTKLWFKHTAQTSKSVNFRIGKDRYSAGDYMRSSALGFGDIKFSRKKIDSKREAPYSMETRNMISRVQAVTDVQVKANERLTNVGVQAHQSMLDNTFKTYKKHGLPAYLVAQSGGGSHLRQTQHLAGSNFRSVPLGDMSKFTNSEASVNLGLGMA